MDQLDRPAASPLNRPWKLSAVLHLIDNPILLIPQNQLLPVVGQAPPVRAEGRGRKHRLQRRGIFGQHQMPAGLQNRSLRKCVLDALGELPARQVHRRRIAVANFNKLLRGRLVSRLVINFIDHHACRQLGGQNYARDNRQDTRAA